VVIRYVSWVGITAHAGFIGLFAWLGTPALAYFNVLSVAAWVGAREANEKGHTRLATWLIVGEVSAHATLAVALLGWNTGFHYYLLPLVPFLMFNGELRTRTVVAGAATVAALYVLLHAATSQIAPPAGWDARAAFVPYLNMLVPLLALAIISVYFRFASEDIERQMEALAMSDPLTRLANRRRMRDLLELERVRFQRSGRPFSVALGDLDDFKNINDTRGHGCGDHVLEHVGAKLRAAVRTQDGVARWGGEEFLVLLPETDAAGARVLAERLRDAIENGGATFEGEPVKITMTFGVATFAGGTIDDCIRRADEALYEGKSCGKNRVVLAERPQAAMAG
jgi:diguanylate cyclase (GGDEF)-like protein